MAKTSSLMQQHLANRDDDPWSPIAAEQLGADYARITRLQRTLAKIEIALAKVSSGS